MSLDIERMYSYLENAGFRRVESLRDHIERALREKTQAKILAVEIINILRPGMYNNTTDPFYWALQNNLDIQVAEMLGRSGYPVPWTEEEYSYF